MKGFLILVLFLQNTVSDFDQTLSVYHTVGSLVNQTFAMLPLKKKIEQVALYRIYYFLVLMHLAIL